MGYAIRSVLQQSFDDFELIVCDNDDDPAATRDVVEKYTDAKIKYIRTGGLDMVSNWNTALNAATGQHVTVLEDKMVFRKDTLIILHNILIKQGCQVVVWNTDTIKDHVQGKLSMVRRKNIRDGVISTYLILEKLKIDITKNWHFLPRGLSSVVSKKIIDEVRQISVKQFYELISPDLTSALKVLAVTDEIYVTKDSLSLITSTQESNGRKVKSGEDVSAKYFLGDKAKELSCQQTLIKRTNNIQNSVVNDYLELCKDFKKLNLYRPAHKDYLRMMVRGWVASYLLSRKSNLSFNEIKIILNNTPGVLINLTHILGFAPYFIKEFFRIRYDNEVKAINLSKDQYIQRFIDGNEIN